MKENPEDNYLDLTLEEVKELLQEESTSSFSLSNANNNIRINTQITDIVINSKEVREGSVFVALKGLHHDGHDFIKEALDKGAIGVIVNSNFNSPLPNLIKVEDTVKALGAISHYYRKKFNLPLIAITGSNGKTTIKEMLKQICSYQFGEAQVLVSPGNFNNYLGLPLTLLKLRSTHKLAILEMGMSNPGEIHYLSRLAIPSIAVVNNVLRSHIEAFSEGLLGIAKAKGEIYQGLSENAIACINVNEPLHTTWLEDCLPNNVQIVKYGAPNTNYHFEFNEKERLATFFTPQGPFKISLKVLGIHNYHNALTALTLASLSGCSFDNIHKGLTEFVGFKQRLELKTAFNGALIIDDSYNANPDSVKVALNALQNLPRPHWVILGDLKGLGDLSFLGHQEVAKQMNTQSIDKLLTIGEFTKIAHTQFEGEKLHFETREEVVEYCLLNLPSMATILVKGSRAMALEKVVNQLIKTI